MFPVRELVEAMGKGNILSTAGWKAVSRTVSAWVSRGKVAFHVQPIAPCLPLCSSGGSSKFGENYGERESVCPHGRVQTPKEHNKQVFSQDRDDFMRIIVTWNSPGRG